MKVICAWCGQRQPDKEPLQDQVITHTMCDDCLKKYNEKLKILQEAKRETQN